MKSVISSILVLLSTNAHAALNANANHDSRSNSKPALNIVAEFISEPGSLTAQQLSKLQAEDGWDGIVTIIDVAGLGQIAGDGTVGNGLSQCSESGIASWYGGSFQGRKTANGEKFNTHSLTAAHKFLQFHTRVLVTNRDNGRSIEVRINDRGPFHKAPPPNNRIIDLSYAAKTALGIDGLGLVQLECIQAE